MIDSKRRDFLPIELFVGFMFAYLLVRSFFSGTFEFENLALGDEI